MEIAVRTGELLHAESDLAVLATFEDASLPAEVERLLEPSDYCGRANQTLLLYPLGALAPRRLLLVGLGKPEKATAETIRLASATAVKEAQRLQVEAITIGVHGDLPLAPEAAAQAFAEGMELGAYRYWRYRTGLTDEQTFVVKAAGVFTKTDERTGAGVARGQIVGRGRSSDLLLQGASCCPSRNAGDGRNRRAVGLVIHYPLSLPAGPLVGGQAPTVV